MRYFPINLIRGSSEICTCSSRASGGTALQGRGPLTMLTLRLWATSQASSRRRPTISTWYPTASSVARIHDARRLVRSRSSALVTDDASWRGPRSTDGALRTESDQRQMVLFPWRTSAPRFAMSCACGGPNAARKGQPEAVELADLFAGRAQRVVASFRESPNQTWRILRGEGCDERETSG